MFTLMNLSWTGPMDVIWVVDKGLWSLAFSSDANPANKFPSHSVPVRPSSAKHFALSLMRCVEDLKTFAATPPRFAGSSPTSNKFSCHSERATQDTNNAQHAEHDFCDWEEHVWSTRSWRGTLCFMGVETHGKLHRNCEQVTSTCER